MLVTYLMSWINEDGTQGKQWLNCDFETADNLAQSFANASAGKAVVSIQPAADIKYA